MHLRRDLPGRDEGSGLVAAKIKKVQFENDGQFWSDAELRKSTEMKGRGWASAWVVYPDQTVRLVTYNVNTGKEYVW